MPCIPLICTVITLCNNWLFLQKNIQFLLKIIIPKFVKLCATFHWFQELNFNILQLSNTIACKNPSLQLIQQNRHCCNFIESYLCIFSCYINFFLFTIIGLAGIVLHLSWSLRYIFYFCIAFIPNILLSVKYMWVFGLCLVLFLLAVSSMILLCKGTMFQDTSYPHVHTFFYSAPCNIFLYTQFNRSSLN